MPAWLTLKLGATIAGAVAVLAFVLLAFHWKDQAADRKAALETICAATRAASGQPKLKCGDVPKQIGFMGQAIGTLTSALHRQSDAVAAMGAETERQQGASAKASQVAQERARAAEATSARLDASSRAGGALAKPCEPSQALVEAWK